MTKYREILRLTALGLSQRNIVQSIGVSQKTVVKVQKRAWEMHLSWPLDESLTDSALETLMLLSRKLNDALSSRLFYAHFDSHRDISHFKSSCFCELFF